MPIAFETIAPSPLLRPYVKYFWTAKLTSPNQRDFYLHTYVDDSSGIIFHHNQGKSAVTCNDIWLPTALVYGQTTKPSLSKCISDFNSVGVLFFPYTLNELFSLDASEATNHLICFSEFTGNKDLTDSILSAPNARRQISLLENFLEDKISNKGKENLLVKNCLSYIERNNTRLGVCELLHHFNVSERKLERNFLHHIGVTPRHYLQVHRFQKVIELFKDASDSRLIDIAMNLDFSDHAHFTKIIKKLSGFTPRKIREIAKHGVINLISADG